MLKLKPCRATFEHERKVYRDHLESLQAMGKEYRSMADEVAKLRAELSNPANVDKRPGIFLSQLICYCFVGSLFFIMSKLLLMSLPMQLIVVVLDTGMPLLTILQYIVLMKKVLEYHRYISFVVFNPLLMCEPHLSPK